MTRAEFQQSEALTSQLKTLLETNPALVGAMDIVLREAKPTSIDHTKGDLLHQAALSGAKVEGYFKFRDNLLSLTNFRKKTIAGPVDEATGHSEAAIAAMVASGQYSEEEAKAAYAAHLAEKQNPTQ